MIDPRDRVYDTCTSDEFDVMSIVGYNILKTGSLTKLTEIVGDGPSANRFEVNAGNAYSCSIKLVL